MVYICYIKYRDNVVICVLAVSNNKLAVRDDDDASSEVAEAGAHAGRRGEVTWMDLDMEQNT